MSILLSGNLSRIHQKMSPTSRRIAANKIPVSPTIYRVIPVCLVSGSKRLCTNRLLLACKRTAGHRLPDFSLNQARIKLNPITVMVKSGNEYHKGTPAL